MNQPGGNHIGDEQLAQWLAGEADEQTRLHLEQCGECRTEAAALRDGISRYAIATRQQAAQAQNAHMAADFEPRKIVALHRLRWAGAVALALALAAPTAWMLKPRPSRTANGPVAAMPARQQAAAAQISDDELLQAVNDDLSREVPEALAPVTAITVARNQMVASARSSEFSDVRGESK